MICGTDWKEPCPISARWLVIVTLPAESMLIQALRSMLGFSAAPPMMISSRGSFPIAEVYKPNVSAALVSPPILMKFLRDKFFVVASMLFDYLVEALAMRTEAVFIPLRMRV